MARVVLLAIGNTSRNSSGICGEWDWEFGNRRHQMCIRVGVYPKHPIRPSNGIPSLQTCASCVHTNCQECVPHVSDSLFCFCTPTHFVSQSLAARSQTQCKDRGGGGHLLLHAESLDQSLLLSESLSPCATIPRGHLGL